MAPDAFLTAGAATPNFSPDMTSAVMPLVRFSIGIARPFIARAGMIAGVELIWANGELAGFVSQIVDKAASSR